MNRFISTTRFVTLGLAIAFLPFSMRFCHLSLLLFLVVCLAEGNFATRFKLMLHNPLIWLLPVLFLACVFGVTYSDSMPDGLAALDKKIAFLLAPVIVATATPFSKPEIKRLMWIFVAACVLGTVVCFVNALYHLDSNAFWDMGPEQPYNDLHPGASRNWILFSYITLASGIGIHPTYFALYLFTCMLIVLRTVSNKWLQTGLIVYLLVFIVLLSSRVVVVATVATLLYVIVTNLRSWVVVAGMIVVVGLLVVNPVARYRNTQEYSAANFKWPPAAMSDNPISIRVSLIWLSLKAIEQTNPLFGTGTADVKEDIATLQSRYGVQNILLTADPHNQYLYTFIELGAMGLLILMAVFLTPLIALYREKEFLACAGWIAFMTVCLTESALESQKGILLFALSVALLGNQLPEWRFTTQRLKYA